MNISKKYILDENKNLIAIQIPIDEFLRIEEVIENYGLSKMVDDVKTDDALCVKDAKDFYNSLNKDSE